MEQFWVILWSVIGTVVTGLATWLTSYLVGLINSKVKDQKLRSFLSKLTEITLSSINSLNQTVVKELKESGKFTKEAGENVKKECIQLIKSQLAPDMVKFIQDNFGDLEQYLSTQIEAFIYQSKH